jgi:hypothetical protein
MLNLRIRSSKKGTQHVKIDSSSSFKQLKQLIQEQTEIPAYQVRSKFIWISALSAREFNPFYY